MIVHITRGKVLPKEIADQIVHRTDGVPLFVEELTKSVLESDLLRKEADCYVLDGALLPLAIPTTLHDLLMARLDRLSGARHVAQIGAAIGREFTYALVHAVCCLPEDELQTGLARLVDANSGLAEKSVAHWARAGQRSAAHSAMELARPRLARCVVRAPASDGHRRRAAASAGPVPSEIAALLLRGTRLETKTGTGFTARLDWLQFLSMMGSSHVYLV